MSNITIFQGYDNPIFVSSGKEGCVYRISDKYAVKVAARKGYKKDMFHEMKIARLLYSFGVSVPEPITCDYVNVRDKVEIGYIMEYVEGISWNDQNISEEVSIVANNLMDMEMSLCSKLGFTDYGLINEQWIFTKDKKIKLIDFTNWQYKDIICQY
jgi:RIO-like serine/threonine protein kinase